MISTATMAGDKDVTMKEMERLALHRVLKFLPRRFIKENQDRLKKLGNILYENVDSVELSPVDIVEYLFKKYGVN